MMKLRNVFLICILLCKTIIIVSSESYFTVVNQTDSSITIHFQLPKYTFSNTKIDSIVYSSIQSIDCQYLESKSNPELPTFSTSILIPENAILDFSINDTSKAIINNINIIPSPGKLKRQPFLSDYLEGEQYSKDEFYPKSAYLFGKTYFIGELQGVAISISPFRFNPIKKKLELTTDMTFTIQFGTNIPISQPKYNKSKVLNQFLNYKDSRLKSGSINQPTSMLVLCPSKYAIAMQSFVKWKNRKGIATYISISDSLKTENDFYSFISSYYLKNKNDYVLLVGDSLDIPQRKIYEIADKMFIASDNAYGNIVGNDSYPEVIIGRLNAGSINDIYIQTNRIINYEKRVENDSTISKYVMVGSNQGPGYNNLYDYQHLHIIADSLNNHYYQGGDELYDGSQGGADSTGDPTPRMFINSINSGKGLFLYTGHSSGNTLVTSSFSILFTHYLTNTNTFPIGIITGCRAGQLSNDTCIASAMLWANESNKPTGMVTMLASTVDQWWNPPMAGQKEFTEALIHGNNVDIIPSFGMLAMKSFIFMNDKFQNEGYKTTDSWSIFGDPSLQIFTKKAVSVITTFNKSLSIGQDTITFSSTNNDAFVCLSFNNTILGIYRVSNGSTFAKFQPLSDSGTFVVTTFGFNIKPTTDSVHISLPKKEFLTISNFDISRNNGIIKNNDTASISLKLKNIGNSIASKYTITITSTDSNIVLLKTSAALQNIAPNIEIDVQSLFSIFIKDNTTDQTNVTVTITLIDSLGKSCSFDKQFIVQAPKLQYVGKIVKPTVYSNTDSIPNPGEIVTVGLIVKNVGHANASITNKKLTSTSQNTFELYSNPFKTILVNSIDTIFYTTGFSSDIPNGLTIPITFNAIFNDHHFTKNEMIKVGEIKETWENKLTSNYPWILNSSSNWFLSDSNAFTGTYSLQSGHISNNQSTVFSVQLTVPSADSISFKVKTSCESPTFIIDHFTYYDFLDFSIDGISMFKQAGLTDWRAVSFPVNSGEHIFSWKYSKDYLNKDGMDAVWIDDIRLPYYEGYNSQNFKITSEPDTLLQVNSTFNYSILSNQINSSFHIIKQPTWLNFNTSILFGESTKIGVDTVIISANSNNMYANQFFTIRTRLDEYNNTSSNILPEIYPNPAKNYLYILNCKNTSNYKIFNSLGSLVQKGNVSKNQIDISTLANSIYTIVISYEQYSISKIFTKIQ